MTDSFVEIDLKKIFDIKKINDNKIEFFSFIFITI